MHFSALRKSAVEERITTEIDPLRLAVELRRASARAGAELSVQEGIATERRRAGAVASVGVRLKVVHSASQRAVLVHPPELLIVRRRLVGQLVDIARLRVQRLRQVADVRQREGEKYPH